MTKADESYGTVESIRIRQENKKNSFLNHS